LFESRNNFKTAAINYSGIGVNCVLIYAWPVTPSHTANRGGVCARN